ncbi:conserved hypothetical protein [Verticillium alfalfae VaMs.102]|uniref:Uncharacterized protein n=1 Tax=Verticillium alfalfae (strain VaMs.102 / ATCC MYA-4576 / FGSC 10136) TaxID=526221 RepID=C9SWE0_VERA1|nr:conserved hypothetical protein [Verticillium alfalfae VaMs.102]EEY23105.1 conserved hypothetical protein [Verticillium alfalfae VaMs.102]
MPNKSRFAFAAAFFLSGQPYATAQRNESLENCPLPIRHLADDRSWNATGTIAIPPLENGDEDWFVSATLTDIRRANVYFDGWPTAQDLAVFLSVPQSFVGSETGNATRVCGYTMPGQNATATGDASSEDSCSSVLPEECIEEALKTPMTPSDVPCPELDLGDKCDVSTGFRTFNPVQLSPSVCVLDSLPHTDVPNGYRSFAGFPGWRIMPPDEEENEFDVYDLRVQQTVPVLFTVQSGSQQKVHLVCVAPNKVVEGSREPQAEFPPSDAGVYYMINVEYRGRYLSSQPIGNVVNPKP